MKVDPVLVHRLFYPQVPLVMSVMWKTRVTAMPVVSYASVSDQPSLVVVACNPASYTCKLALKARSFSLSVLDADRMKAVERLATTSGSSLPDKLSSSGLPHSRGRTLRVPVLEGAEATLEVSLKSRRRTGDHVLFLGEVKDSYASDAFTDSWDFDRYTPILYTGWRDGLSTYRGVTG